MSIRHCITKSIVGWRHLFISMLWIMMIGITSGCTVTNSSSFAFLGIPESESGEQGPIGLIKGKPCQIKNVTPVFETSYQQYEQAKQAGSIYVEEPHAGYIYYAVKKQRDVRFDNASAWVEVLERYKAKKEVP